jgi:hypothetical protein
VVQSLLCHAAGVVSFGPAFCSDVQDPSPLGWSGNQFKYSISVPSTHMWLLVVLELLLLFAATNPSQQPGCMS